MELTRSLKGREIEAVMCNGHVVAIQCKDGSEIRIAWVGEDGRPVKGRPVLEGRGVRLKAAGMRELMQTQRTRL